MDDRNHGSTEAFSVVDEKATQRGKVLWELWNDPLSLR